MSPGDTPAVPSLEEQVALLTERLHQAQKLTALGELASTTSQFTRSETLQKLV